MLYVRNIEEEVKQGKIRGTQYRKFRRKIRYAYKLFVINKKRRHLGDHDVNGETEVDGIGS
jgi:hypothetical protein